MLTLGLVLDASGFVQRSRVFAGNVRETTLAGMLTALKTPPGALVILAGYRTEAQVAWLKANHYRYIWSAGHAGASSIRRTP